MGFTRREFEIMCHEFFHYLYDGLKLITSMPKPVLFMTDGITWKRYHISMDQVN